MTSRCARIGRRSRKATGSTPMAMRWPFCKRLGAVMLAAACVHTVTTYYLPDAHNPRFDTDGAAQVLDQYLRVQCPERLAAKKAERGNARLTITIDTSGSVTRAELVSSSCLLYTSDAADE